MAAKIQKNIFQTNNFIKKDKIQGNNSPFLDKIQGNVSNIFARQLPYLTSTQHPDQQRHDEDDDKERRTKAAQKMMHGDLFLRGLLPSLGVVLSLSHRITGVFGKKEK